MIAAEFKFKPVTKRMSFLKSLVGRGIFNI